MTDQKIEITNTTHFFESCDKVRKLFYQKHSPDANKIRATLVITHGLGEHSDVYNHVSEALASELSINVISWDMVGHGRSSGQRGYVGDVSWFIKDFSQLLRSVREDSTAPLFLLSHSLGGLVTLASEQNHIFEELEVAGIILSNPCTKLNFTPPKWKTLGAEFLTKLAPRLTLGNEISTEQLSSVPSYMKRHKEDSLRHSRISPRLFLGMLELINSLKSYDSKTPSLTLLSPKDSVCDAENAVSLLKNRSEIVFFEKSMHEVLNDIEKDLAISKIKDFLNEHV